MQSFTEGTKPPVAKDTIAVDQLRRGDVILTAQRWADLGGVFIRLGNFFKRGFHERIWCHAAIYVGDGEIVEALPHGVEKNRLDEAYLNRDFNLRVMRYRNATPEQMEAAADFAVSKIGVSYEQKQQLYFVLNYCIAPSLRFALESPFFEKVFQDRGSYFCSELVAAAYQAAGAYPFERSPRKIMPLDFYNPLIFELAGERIRESDDRTHVGVIRNFLSYCVYLAAAFFFFAIDAALAIVLVLCAHIVLFSALIVSTVTALLDLIFVQISKRRLRGKD